MKREIGDIGNYYGCLEVKSEDGKYYWGIENYDGIHYQEIPESLFIALNNFQDSQEEL